MANFWFPRLENMPLRIVLLVALVELAKISGAALSGHLQTGGLRAKAIFQNTRESPEF
jgi:hypothetical protein